MGWCNDSLQSEAKWLVVRGCGLVLRPLTVRGKVVGSPRMWVGVIPYYSPRQSVGSPRMWVGVKTLNSPRQSGW